MGRGDNAYSVSAREYWKGDFIASERLGLGLSNKDVDALNEAIINWAPHHQGPYPTDQVARLDIERLRTVDDVMTRKTLEISFRAHDRVLFTRAMPEKRIPKSSLATVTRVNNSVVTLAIDGRNTPVEIDVREFNGLDYGFAVTVHKSQGITKDQGVFLHLWINIAATLP